MKNVFLLGLTGMLGIGMAGIALAQDGAMPMDMGAMGPGMAQAAPGGAMPMNNMGGMGQAPASASAISASGVVRQVKPEAGKLKISHEPIAARGWPAMTMDFRVADKAMLEGLSVGDKVAFQLGKDARGMMITGIQKAGQCAVPGSARWARWPSWGALPPSSWLPVWGTYRPTLRIAQRSTDYLTLHGNGPSRAVWPISPYRGTWTLPNVYAAGPATTPPCARAATWRPGRRCRKFVRGSTPSLRT